MMGLIFELGTPQTFGLDCFQRLEDPKVSFLSHSQLGIGTWPLQLWEDPHNSPTLCWESRTDGTLINSTRMSELLLCPVGRAGDLGKWGSVGKCLVSALYHQGKEMVSAWLLGAV